jgi:hypothetical protein
MGSQFGSGGQRLFWEDARWGACWTVGMGVFGARLFPGVCGVQTASPYHWIDIVAINQHRKTAEEKDGLRGLHAMAQNDGYRRSRSQSLRDAEGPRLEGIAGRRHLKNIRSAFSSSKETKQVPVDSFGAKHRDEECPGI